MSRSKRYLNKDVYTAAIERLDCVYDEFEDVCVSFSGGKDSTVLLHLTLEVARRRGRLPVSVLFIDLEGQYKSTIDHIREMITDEIEMFWVCLPLNLRNSVSQFQPYWCCWDPAEREKWVRDLPEHPSVISDTERWGWFRPRMEFEEFVPAFNEWFADGRQVASLVGIRSDESLNRYRTIVRTNVRRWKGKRWTAKIGEHSTNCYPIYDWRTEDIWTYNGQKGLPYNKLYDLMYLAGRSIHDMRICQPYGDDQRKGLDLFHKIEPETWFRTVQRVAGANYGSIYRGQKLLGNIAVELPAGHTYESFSKLLLSTMPPYLRDHYQRRIDVFLDWWVKHGFPVTPDEPPPDDHPVLVEGGWDRGPSWKRICKVLMKNDYLCKALSFAQNKREWEKLEALKEKYRGL